MTALRAMTAAPISGIAAAASTTKTNGTHVDMLAYHQMSSIKHEARAKKEAERAEEAAAVRLNLGSLCVSDVSASTPLDVSLHPAAADLPTLSCLRNSTVCSAPRHWKPR
jgi:hypothetical protein